MPGLLAAYLRQSRKRSYKTRFLFRGGRTRLLMRGQETARSADRYPLGVPTSSTSLTSDQVERLTADAALGRGPSIEGAAAKKFYDRLRREVRKAARDGLVIEVPHEHPDLSD